eukprot:351347-Chlamydomonas_euryale.AAC.1
MAQSTQRKGVCSQACACDVAAANRLTWSRPRRRLRPSTRRRCAAGTCCSASPFGIPALTGRSSLADCTFQAWAGGLS